MPDSDDGRPAFRGRFMDPATVELETGQTITGIQDTSTFCRHTYLTGWLAGVLYESRDGETWREAKVAFRA